MCSCVHDDRQNKRILQFRRAFVGGELVKAENSDETFVGGDLGRVVDGLKIRNGGCDKCYVPEVYLGK